MSKSIGCTGKNIEKGTEDAIVWVGALDYIKRPIVALVRLTEAILMTNASEVNLPISFIVILLTLSGDLDMDHHKIDRSLSTLKIFPFN